MKESKAWDEKTDPARSLGLSTDRPKEPETPPAERALRTARFEEGTTGRTRVRTSCPVHEPRGVSLESGYSTNLSVPTPAEEQQDHRPGKAPGSARLYVEYNRPRNRPRALQGGR